MTPQEIQEFEKALEQIVALAKGFGLDFFEMRYEICPAHVIYSLGAYGMPSRFNHWSFGKAYHRMKTQYDYNLSRIYELVINSNPCYAFLLEGNSVLQNKVIAAHVLAHSDFFKNNRRFAHTSRNMVETMAASAERIRSYEFRYGRKVVEEVLDACLALQYHVDPYLVRHPPPHQKPTVAPAESKDERRSTPYDDLWELDQPGPNDPGKEVARNTWTSGASASRGERRDLGPKQLSRTDLLLHLSLYSPHLQDWERDILSIVRGEMLYFYPQLETKIMNEGWASLWHARIMREMDLTDEESIEFAKMHAGVLQPSPFSINPYRVGYEIFTAIEAAKGTEAIFEVRECENDASFLRNHLTEELVESLDLYLYRQVDGQWVVVEKDWKAVRDHLAKQASHGGIPCIEVVDEDYQGNGELMLLHRYEGEELDQRYVDKTLPYVYRLWGRPVHLETVVDGQSILVSYDGRQVRRRGPRKMESR